MTEEFKSVSDKQGWLNVLVRSREASLVLLIAALTALTTALNPRFLSPQSLKDLMLNVSIIALLVLGQTVIILMRQIDLSIKFDRRYYSLSVWYALRQPPRHPWHSSSNSRHVRRPAS